METHDENGRAIPTRVMYRTKVAPTHDDNPAKTAYIEDYLRRRQENNNAPKEEEPTRT